MSAGRPGDERGSAAIWVVSCCVLLAVVATVATVRALAVLARHRAEVGADLAALAAAGQIGRANTSACPAAARIARQNGARLLSCRLRLGADGRNGSVVVRVVLRAGLPVVGSREVVASAWAARLPGAAPAPASGSVRSASRPGRSTTWNGLFPAALRPVACWLPSSVRAPPGRCADEGMG